MYKIAVILAGGFGSRLFPLSRINYPKQFIKLFGDESLLSITYNRLKNLSIFDEIWICANKKHYYLVLRDVPNANIILEEDSKNTSFAIVYSIFYLLNNLGLKEADFSFFPSDHYIFEFENFDIAVRNLIRYMEEMEGSFIVGVKPHFPSTEYGYIKKAELMDGNLYKVDRFVEKPSKSKARYYIKTGNYLWNSGIYSFNSNFFLNDFFKLNPSLAIFDSYNKLVKDKEMFPNISIDFLYSQKTKNLFVLEGNFHWSDLGSFEEISKIVNYDHNVINYNSKVNLLIDEFQKSSGSKKYCFINVKDLIIVDTKDFQLISKRGKSNSILRLLDSITEESKSYNTFDYRPWGYYREIEQVSEKYRIKHIVIYPFKELSLQYHNHRDEYWVVLAGSGNIVLDGQLMRVSKGSFLHIPKNTVHKVINDSDKNLEIIEIQLGSLLSESDIVRIEDKYGRDK